jgi:uncharacterized protein YbjT (DUF2867 family)
MTNRILVIGGSGLLGMPVVRHLLAEDYMVRVLTRSPEKTVLLFGGGCEAVLGNVTDPDSLHTALLGCQAVYINLSGTVNVRIEALCVQNILKIAGGFPLQRIIYHSSTSVTAANCWFPPVAARYRVEQSLRLSPIPHTIFHSGYFMELLPALLSRNLGILPGRQPFAFHWFSAPDYARMVSLCLAAPGTVNKTFNVQGPSYLRLKDALRIYCAAFQPRPRILSVPLWVASLSAALSRRRPLQAALPILRYGTKMPEDGDPGEANTLLVTPKTTLEQWCSSLPGALPLSKGEIDHKPR